MKTRLIFVRPSLLFVLSFGLLLCVSSAGLAQTSKKGKQVVAYSASSVKDYLEYALHHNYCYPVKDAFDKRACKKRWKAFAGKMLKWVKGVWIVDDGVEVKVRAYNFKRKVFAIHHSADVVATSESDLRGSVVIGKGRCDKMTGIVEVGQTITIRIPPKKAAKHPLREAAGEQSVTALLKGRLGRVNWCCDASSRREARADGENCKAKVFLYTMKGFILDEDFRHRFPKNVVTREFEPKVLGGYLPTGSGDFEKAGSSAK